jgi:hypothetical protein
MEWKVVDCQGYNNTIMLTTFANYKKANGKYQHHKRGASQQKTKRPKAKKGVMVVLVMLLNITIKITPLNNTMNRVKNSTTSSMKNKD